jgi:hypothetical protein
MLGYVYIITDIILPTVEDYLNSELYKYAGDLFREGLLFLNLYIMRKMPEELKISVVILVYKKGEKEE